MPNFSLKMAIAQEVYAFGVRGQSFILKADPDFSLVGSLFEPFGEALSCPRGPICLHESNGHPRYSLNGVVLRETF
jgi:hypothetical protein